MPSFWNGRKSNESTGATASAGLFEQGGSSSSSSALPRLPRRAGEGMPSPRQNVLAWVRRSKADAYPGHETQARWRADPHRNTLWQWTRAAPLPEVNQANPLSDIDASLRFKWAVDVSQLCCAAAQRQAKLLNSCELQRRRNAAKVLGIFGVAAAHHSRELTSGLMDGDSTVRERVVWAIGRLGSAGCGQAKENLKRLHASSESCKEAVAEARKLCNEAQAAGRYEESQKDLALRSSSAFRFTKADGMKLNVSSSAPSLKPSANQFCLDEHLRHIIRNMKDDDPSVRYKAVRLARAMDVESMATPPWEIAAHLVVRLEDPVESIVMEAAQVFAKMALASRAHLAHRLEVGSLQVRRDASHCLLQAGTAASPHLQVLQLMQKDPDEQIRKNASLAVSNIALGDGELENYISSGIKADSTALSRKSDGVPDGLVVEPRAGSWRLKRDDPRNAAFYEQVRRMQESLPSAMTSRSKWGGF